jgi:hypothetical protein
MKILHYLSGLLLAVAWQAAAFEPATPESTGLSSQAIPFTADTWTTPLILAEGLHGVRALRTAIPDIPIVADLKTMDGGYLEAEMMDQAPLARPQRTIPRSNGLGGAALIVLMETQCSRHICPIRRIPSHAHEPLNMPGKEVTCGHEADRHYT